MKKIFNKIKKKEFKDPILIGFVSIVFATILIDTLIYTQLIAKQMERKKEKKEELSSKKQELNSIYAMKPRLESLREEQERKQATLDSLRDLFPDKIETPKLMRDIVRVARHSGVKSLSFSPEPDSVKKHYVENRNTMSVRAGYHELAKFFNYLANFKQIINLTEVEMKSSRELKKSMERAEKHGGSIKSIDATFGITTFSSRTGDDEDDENEK